MSIETTSSAGHKASAGHEARGAKGRNAGAADAAAQGPQGFLSILSAMDEVQADPLGTAALQDATVTDPNAALNMALPAPQQVKDENLQLPLDAAALLAQGAQLQPGAGEAVSQTSAGVATGPDGLRPAAVPRGRDTTAALQPATHEAELPLAAGKKPGLALGRDKDKKNALPDQAAAVAQVATQKDQPKDVRQFLATEIQRALQPVQALVQTAIAEVARSEKRSDERSVFGSAATPGNNAAAASVGSQDPGFNLAAPTEAAAPAEVQVAEQVHYWISQDVQNAEMKLDGLGENPVEVSIRMQGNEAHVAFRSDEAATRGMLEGAEGHLKDLLQREGLQLAGVSVGTSGPQGQGAQNGQSGERRPREGVRTARVAPAVLEPLNVPRHNTGQGERAVDLFV